MSIFIDKALISVEAGRGGDGVVAWRHEKFVDSGGPSGGNGGRGGNIVFVADKSVNTLQSFRFNELIKAEAGVSGARQNKHGRGAEDRIVKVPIGTQVLENDIVIADLVEDGQSAVVAKGGKGGFGNAHFKSSTRQAPRVAEKGEPGEKLKLELELKLIADVGLIGLPNAGKSTLLSVISNARPEIADYPFTTLTPHLGVVDVAGGSLLVADIPGLIEGASQGKGLGLDFLRHIERTAVLIQMVDAYSDNVVRDFKIIENELASYKINLKDKLRIVTLSKIDGLAEKEVAKKKQALSKVASGEVLAISAHTKEGVHDLLDLCFKKVSQYRAQVEAVAAEKLDDDDTVYINLEDDESFWRVDKLKTGWKVSGKKIERFANMTDTDNYFSLERLKDIMQRLGIMHELARHGAQPGDKIRIGTADIIL